jgi:ribonuclease VapC
LRSAEQNPLVSEAIYILDASAIMALVRRETGFERVEAALGSSVISAVNYSEVVAKLCDRNIPSDLVETQLSALQLDIISFDEDQAVNAGSLRAQTRALGLSFGDRACLALAIMKRGVALTADRVWESLDIGVEIVVIR